MKPKRVEGSAAATAAVISWFDLLIRFSTQNPALLAVSLGIVWEFRVRH